MENHPQILICDDEPLITESIKAILSTNGYRIETTNSSRHALTLIHANTPDLVILDVMMPEMTGFQVLDAVDRDKCDTAFIIVTGEASVDSAIKAIRKGASDYLKKPFEPDELIIRVENALKQRQIKHENTCVLAENRQLENQLRQSQKMEAIGTLAGGIAHDFNNVLSIILGNTELALADLPQWNASRQNIEKILTASLRAREMVQQLLSFSRKEESSRNLLVLNSVISESLKLIRSSLPTNIVIKRNICEINCTVIANATEIHQIMLNLCTNSAHAMEPAGGVLTIRLEPVTLDEAAAADIDEMAPGNYARLVVADTGRGIDRDTIGRIFDPYFTTKEIGKGTGMGLSVVHGIIKGCGGTIQVFSRSGQYTEFHIYLPMVDVAIDEDPINFSQQPLPGGNEHILIVDDEEMLMDMMRQVLEQLGYTVTAHTDSSEALKAFFLCPQIYDLLITDMTMPQLTGTDLAKEVKAIREDVPIILCTGYNEQISEENAQSLGIQALIMKPVGMHQLAEAIRSVLTPTSTDRRSVPRYSVPTGTFVISRTAPYERCSLVDIGMLGLAFSHKMAPAPSEQIDHLAIVTPNSDICMEDIRCRIVSDIPAESGVPLHESNLVRRSVRFEDLTMRQAELLNQFIQNHAQEKRR